MESITDIFGRVRPIKKTGKPMDERAALINFFEKQGFTYKSGHTLAASDIGRHLSHYNLSDLYALKSAFLDRKNRDGVEAARKYWWAMTKTRAITNDP